MSSSHYTEEASTFMEEILLTPCTTNNWLAWMLQVKIFTLPPSCLSTQLRMKTWFMLLYTQKRFLVSAYSTISYLLLDKCVFYIYLGGYNPQDAGGFIRINSIRLRAHHAVSKKFNQKWNFFDESMPYPHLPNASWS